MWKCDKTQIATNLRRNWFPGWAGEACLCFSEPALQDPRNTEKQTGFSHSEPPGSHLWDKATGSISSTGFQIVLALSARLEDQQRAIFLREGTYHEVSTPPRNAIGLCVPLTQELSDASDTLRMSHGSSQWPKKPHHWALWLRGH